MFGTNAIDSRRRTRCEARGGGSACLQLAVTACLQLARVLYVCSDTLFHLRVHRHVVLLYVCIVDPNTLVE